MTAVLNDPATDGQLAGAGPVVLTSGCAGTREAETEVDGSRSYGRRRALACQGAAS